MLVSKGAEGRSEREREGDTSREGMREMVNGSKGGEEDIGERLVGGYGEERGEKGETGEGRPRTLL